MEKVEVLKKADGAQLSLWELPIAQHVAEGILETPENERGPLISTALAAGMPLARQLGQEALTHALESERIQVAKIAEQSVQQLQLAGTTLSQTLDQKTTALRKELIDLFANADSPIPDQIRAKVLSAVRDMPEEYAKIVQRAVQQMQTQTAMQHQTLLDKIAELQRLIAIHEAVQKEAARGTHKGRVHEDIVDELLSRLLRETLTEDLTGRRVSNEKDLKGGTKGDFLIYLQDQPLVVIEAKHENHSKKTFRAMNELAENYREARGAAFCVFVYATIEEAPVGRNLHIDVRHRWASCVVDPSVSDSEFFLLSALQVAILMAQQFLRATEQKVPWNQLTAHVEALVALIHEAIDGSKSIKSLLEQSVKSATAGRDAFGDWIGRMETLIHTLDQLIRAELDQAS